MYNSRTQISTTNGLPIELANSGKVDGVRYLTEKEGCVNKWSIKITPNGVYFIDDLNYSINVLQGSSLSRLSEELGFSQWCKDNIVPYKLWTINNGGFRTYYDRILNDVYFSYGNKSLVYSEKLGQFMSFMDYPSSYAMDNIDDTFISFNFEHPSNIDSKVILFLVSKFETSKLIKFSQPKNIFSKDVDKEKSKTPRFIFLNEVQR